MMKRRSSLSDEALLHVKGTPVLVSACLLGVRCRYDGRHNLCPDLTTILASVHIIPFCPEQLGGLPTPRPPANIIHGDGWDVLDGVGQVVDAEGRDFTGAFRKGAYEALRLARVLGAYLAVVKDRSPSCGLITPHCENEKGSGPGVTAALFGREGIRLLEQGRGVPFFRNRFLKLLGTDHFRDHP
jgi:uncharacterized protein YbbK (DUF523 family)